MAHLELKPPPPVDFPRTELTLGRVNVDWLARWPEYGDLDRSSKIRPGVPYYEALPIYAFRDPANEEDARKWASHLGLRGIEDLVYGLANPSDNQEAATRPRTPIWLSSPPPPKPQKPPFEGEDDDGPFIYVLYPSAVVELLVASVSLENWPERDAEDRIHLPEDCLQETLEAVEIFADLLSISNPSSRSLSSPRFPVGLQGENQEEEAWLESSAGIFGLSHADVDVTHGNHKFHLLSLPPDAFGDRLDGVKILADAFSQLWPTGQFRELWRFFERAFRLPSGRMTAPLGDFLSSGSDPYQADYSRREVSEWVKLRGPVVHGDRRDTVALSADVEPVLGRMEFAAKDVLLHKDRWRDPSVGRRVLALNRKVLPKGHPAFERTQSPGNTIYSTQLTVRAFPAFGSGPLRWTEGPLVPELPGMYMKSAPKEEESREREDRT